jgi:hypothetical protein
MRVAVHNRRASMAVSRAIPQLVNAEAACMYDTRDTYMTSSRHRMACCQDYSMQNLFDLLPPRFFVQQRPESPVKTTTKEPNPTCPGEIDHARVYVCIYARSSQRHHLCRSDKGTSSSSQFSTAQRECFMEAMQNKRFGGRLMRYELRQSCQFCSPLRRCDSHGRCLETEQH